MSSKLDPSALSVGDAVKVLQAAGSRHASDESVRADIEAGAPINLDGTVNLVHYCAWMVARLAHGQDQAHQELRADGRSDARGDD